MHCYPSHLPIKDNSKQIYHEISDSKYNVPQQTRRTEFCTHKKNTIRLDLRGCCSRISIFLRPGKGVGKAPSVLDGNWPKLFPLAMVAATCRVSA